MIDYLIHYDMEEKEIKSLFANFEPELSSDSRFMNKLQRNLNSVEIIKRHAAEVRSRNKKAVAIATVVGFIVGFLFSLSLPYIMLAISDWQLTLPHESILNSFADNFPIIAWCVVGATSVLAALNTYELSLSLLKPKDSTTD